jgi:hypothetical protein
MSDNSIIYVNDSSSIEVVVSNQQGPQGIPGPTGPTGATANDLGFNSFLLMGA